MSSEGGGKRAKEKNKDSVPRPLENGVDKRVVCQEMCCYCFDVLIGHLTNSHAPRSPYFTNEE